MESSGTGAAVKAGFLTRAKPPKQKKAVRDNAKLNADGGGAKDTPSIDELLRRPDAELTQWALEQAEKVVDPHVEVEQLEVFKYARAFAVATGEQRQQLMDKGLAGFKDMGAVSKGKALRFFMRHGDIMEVLLEAVKKADATKPKQKEQPTPVVQEPEKKPPSLDAAGGSAKAAVEQTGANVASEEQLRDKDVARDAIDSSAKAANEPADTDAASEKRPRERNIAARRETSDVVQRGFLLKAKSRSAAVRNIQRVAQEAGFNERPAAEDELWRALVREQAPSLLQPGAVLDAVVELNEEERIDLADTLVRTKLIPAIRRGDLLAAMHPGGFTDKLKLAVRIGSALYRYAWLAIALCAVESFPFPGREWPCAYYLELWLRMDSLLCMALVIAALAACKALQPAATIWGEDAVGTAFRFREAMTSEESWKGRLEAAFPGVDYESFKTGSLRTFVTFVILFFVVGWASAGLALCLWTAFTHRCTGVEFWVGVIFVVFRAASAVAIVAPAVVFRRWYRLRYAEQRDDPEKGKSKKED